MRETAAAVSASDQRSGGTPDRTISHARRARSSASAALSRAAQWPICRRVSKGMCRGLAPPGGGVRSGSLSISAAWRTESASLALARRAARSARSGIGASRCGRASSSRTRTTVSERPPTGTSGARRASSSCWCSCTSERAAARLISGKLWRARAASAAFRTAARTIEERESPCVGKPSACRACNRYASWSHGTRMCRTSPRSECLFR